MSDLAKRIIEEAINKKPLAIKELVDEALVAKSKEIIETVKPEFADMTFNGVEEELEEDETEADDEDLEAFFTEFEAEYGHLPEDEQLDMLEMLEAELDAEEAEELDEDELEEGELHRNKKNGQLYKRVGSVETSQNAVTGKKEKKTVDRYQAAGRKGKQSYPYDIDPKTYSDHFEASK